MSKNNNFIEHSIVGTLSFFKESVFADEYASKKEFLQKRDARIKTATFLLLLLTVLFTRDVHFIAGMYLFVLALVCLSGINILFFLKRTWIFIPLFSLFIAIPALFSVFSPGEPLFVFNIFNIKLIITSQGLFASSLFVMRVVTSVSLVILLTLTTKHNELLKALRFFKIPQVFVMTLGMCYRYIYLFAGIIENTYLAIKSRAGFAVYHKKGREIVAWNIASLWQRSYQFNNEVYNAMLSRGYRGEPQVLDEFKAGLIDWMVLVCSIIFFILILIKGAGI